MRSGRLLHLLGATVGVALLALLLLRAGPAAVWGSIIAADLVPLAAVVPVVCVNMALRARRWQILFARENRPRLAPVATALLAGYLANNVLPARGGDVLRAWLLGNSTGRAKSEVLATVLVERVFDLITLALMLGAAMLLMPVPAWLQSGGLVLAASAAAGLLVLCAVAFHRAEAIEVGLRLLGFLPGWVLLRVRIVLAEFVAGIAGFARIATAAEFAAITALLWASEIAVALLVAQAFGLSLAVLDGLVVMVFAALSSLVPALPGQVGAFEFAVAAGMESLGRSGGAVAAFALGWHFLALVVTSLLGAASLAIEGESLLPARRRAADAPRPSFAAGE